MPLLNDQVRAETGKILAAMRDPVVMTCFTEAECHPCAHVLELAEEVEALAPAPALRLEVRDLLAHAEEAARLGVTRVPALALARAGAQRVPIRYLGLPAGHEFGAFLRTLLLLSTGAGMPGVDAAAVAPIVRPARLQLFVLAACPRCPEMALLCNSIAVASPLVTAEIIDADSFPDLVARFAVGAVPKTIINESVELTDVVPAASLIARIAAA